MSQEGIIDIIGTHPEIPTEFIANVGFAVPIANTLEILGSVVAAGTNPLRTIGSGNTIDIQAQITQAIGATNATNIGLAAFNSADFTVDANGFVSLLGPAALSSFNVDASTPPGTDPVVPDGGGMITVTGGQIAAGTTVNVIQTNSLAANTYTIQVQRSSAQAATTIGANGVAHFSSAMFSVDANGFVTLVGGGQAVDSIAVQTGTSPIVPSAAGLITINGAVVSAGTNPVRTDGTGANTLAVEVQISQALAATDATKIGLCNFDSAGFSVDANGFVALQSSALGVLSVSGTANRITSTGGQNPVIDISGAYVGQTSITTLGTIATGVWEGTAVGPTFGGTGQTTYATGDILYASAPNVLSKLAATTNGFVLTLAGGIPSWASNGSGDVVGPGSATDNALVRFDGTTGKLIKNGIITEDNTGNLLQSTAVSGASLSIITSNTSNTASATAFNQVQVAGSTASDAYYEANISGGQAWTWGLDNSDSDAYVLSASGTPGTTNVMRAATSGEINYPLQPAFLGVLGTNDTNATGNGATYTLGAGNALTEVFDQNGDFTTGGVFTAPVTGRYFLSTSLTYAALTAVMTFVVLGINTSNRVYSNGYINIGLVRTIAAASDFGYSSLSCFADMDAGDTCTVTAAIHGGAGNTATISASSARVFMSGFLAC